MHCLSACDTRSNSVSAPPTSPVLHGLCHPQGRVQVLGVKHVLVCGHSNCGAIKAALTLPSASALLTNCWISQIRDTRNAHAAELANLSTKEQVARLARLNVTKQVFNVCTSPVLQQAWQSGTPVAVHGLLYDVATGALTRLVGPLAGNDSVPSDMTAALQTCLLYTSPSPRD